METTVSNVKVAFIRPKFNNLLEWCMDCNNIYIGRKGIVFIEKNGSKERFPKQDSIWANPFKLKGDSEEELTSILNQYYFYIIDKIEKENLYDELEKLRGKNLGCWCKPKRCHGDVLLYLLSIKK